jgi:hypothetical protein
MNNDRPGVVMELLMHGSTLFLFCFFLAQVENSIARKGTKIQPPMENQCNPRGNQEIMPL